MGDDLKAYADHQAKRILMLTDKEAAERDDLEPVDVSKVKKSKRDAT